MSAPCPYELCDGTGWRTNEDANTAFPCRCRPQRIARAKTRRLEGAIPRHYQGVSLDRPPIADMPSAVVRPIRSYVANVEAQIDQGRGLWLYGDVGTGKTTLAMLVSKTALGAGRSVAVYSLPRLLALIRRTYAENSRDTESDVLERLTAVDLLHIDDLGAESGSDWVQEQIYSIINARYEQERAVVVTANVPRPKLPTETYKVVENKSKSLDASNTVDAPTSLDFLEERIGWRIASRLREMCEVVPVFGADRRVAERESEHLAELHARVYGPPPARNRTA